MFVIHICVALSSLCISGRYFEEPAGGVVVISEGLVKEVPQLKCLGIMLAVSGKLDAELQEGKGSGKVKTI